MKLLEDWIEQNIDEFYPNKNEIKKNFTDKHLDGTIEK